MVCLDKGQHDYHGAAGHASDRGGSELQRQRGLFYPPDPGEKTASIGGNVITQCRRHALRSRYGLTRDFVRCIEAVLRGWKGIVQFSSNVVKHH